MLDVNSNAIMYADDTVLLSRGKNVDDALRYNQNILTKYVEWSDLNGLKINVTKTKQMFFNSRNKNHCSSETFLEDNKPVGNTDKYVYLGVTMNIYLTFEPFLKSIIQKVNYKLYIFSMIRYILPFNAAVHIYKQMVLPFFNHLDILIDSVQKHYNIMFLLTNYSVYNIVVVR